MLAVVLAIVSAGGYGAAPVRCGDRMQVYVEYCRVFKHYEAWEKWKWHNLLMDDSMDDWDLPDLWEDFLLDLPDDSEYFVKTVTALRDLLNAGVQPTLATSLLCALEATAKEDDYDDTDFFDEYFENFWDNKERIEAFIY